MTFLQYNSFDAQHEISNLFLNDIAFCNSLHVVVVAHVVLISHFLLIEFPFCQRSDDVLLQISLSIIV